MLRVDMDPQEMIAVLNGRVFDVCTKINTLELDLAQASQMVSEFLLPRLEMGLIFARIADPVLRKWTP